MSDKSTQRAGAAFNLLFWEGAFAMVHDTWTGPAYLAGLAGELKAPVACVALLCSAAWIGAVGQLVGSWTYERARSYKRHTLRLALAARALWLLPLFMAAFWWQRGGGPFPIQSWCALTAVVACVAALLGASSGAAWSSWVRALVPVAMRGRFFGERQRYVTVALIAANGIAALCVSWRPHGVFAGFALLGCLTLCAAGLSTLLLGRVPEVGDAGRPSGAGPRGFEELAAWVRRPLRDPAFRGVVVYGALFNGAMQVGSPYFSYYFAGELGLSMSRIALWTALSSVGCWLATEAWGRHLDRSAGNARGVLRAMGLLTALSPLYYVTSNVAWVRAIAPLDYLVSGAVWCGYTLALTTLLYRSIPEGCGPAFCFSLYSAAAGLCGALGSLLGGKLAVWLAPWGGFRALWVVTAVLRLAVVVRCYRGLLGGAKRAATEIEPITAEPVLSEVS